MFGAGISMAAVGTRLLASPKLVAAAFTPVSMALALLAFALLTAAALALVVTHTRRLATRAYTNRLATAAHPVGVAITRAAIDSTRCGYPEPVSRSFLERAYQHYLPSARAPQHAASFADGLTWATERFRAHFALLTQAETADTWRAPSLLARSAPEMASDIPEDIWRLVILEAGTRSASLLAIARAASRVGESEIAKDVWAIVEERGDDRSSRTAAVLRRAITDAHAQEAQGSLVPQLLGRVEERPLRRALTARAPARVRLTGPRADNVFDPRLPDTDTGELGGAYFKLYRYRTIRFVLRTLLLVAFDTLSTLIGLAAAILVKAGLHTSPIAQVFDTRWALSTFCVAFTLPALALVGAYSADSKAARLDRLILAFTASAALAAAVGAAHGQGIIYSTTAWASFLFVLPVCYAFRAGYDRVSRDWVKQHGLHTRVLLVGSQEASIQAARHIRHTIGRPMTIVGYVTHDNSPQPGRLGHTDELEDVVRAYAIHHVVIADSNMPPTFVLRLFDRCTLLNVVVDMVLSLNEMQIYNKRVPVGGTIVLHRLSALALSPADAMMKRCLDVLGASFALVVISPALALLSLGVWLGSGRPAFFQAFIPGKGQATFGLLKLRTTTKPDETLDDGFSKDAVTRLGHVMRRYALDDLPQLVNVVRGEMSLVGPRPVRIDDYDRMEAWHRLRYVVKPGITGPWQIAPRPRVLNYDDMARHDLLYMRSWSLWRDLEILLRTPLAILRGI